MIKKFTKSAKIYTEIKQRNLVIKKLLTTVIFFVMSFTPLSNLFLKVSEVSSYSFLQFSIFMILTGFFYTLLVLPFNYYNSFVVEQDFNLSNESSTEWLSRYLKKLLINYLLFFLISTLLFISLKVSQTYCFLFFGLLLSGCFYLFTNFYHKSMTGLFHNLSPINHDIINSRLLKLIEKDNINMSEIITYKSSNKSSKVKALCSGVGKYKNILISDTILKELNPREVNVILTQKVAYHCKKQIIKRIIIDWLLIMFSLVVSGVFYSRTIYKFGFLKIDSIGAIPIFLLYLSMASIVLFPLRNIISRRLELEADIYALKTSRSPKSFISAIKKISSVNLSDSEPEPIMEFIFYDEPSIAKRVKLAESFIK